MKKSLTDFKVLTFDCYGTLIDWETGLLNSLSTLVDHLARPIGKEEVLNTYSWYEIRQQACTPTKSYADIMATVYQRIAEEWGICVTWNECVRFGESIRRWTAFPDSAEALAYLKQHYQLVILSNVDNLSFASSNESLGVSFDAVYTSQDIGNYKPDLRNFQYMLDMLARRGIDKSEILHTAQSLVHDHTPANRLGLQSCWVDRRHGELGGGATPQPVQTPHYDFRFTSMGELANEHRRALS